MGFSQKGSLKRDGALMDEMQAERTQTDQALRLLGAVAAPADLALRLRLAISHERVRAERRWSGRLAYRFGIWFDSKVRPLGVQIAVAATALVMLAGGAAMLGAVAPQQAVEANDAPLAGFSAPRYLYSITEMPTLNGSDGQPLIVQAEVNAKGEVYSYHLLSGSLDEAAATKLRERMLSSVFEPAEVFGEPVRGSVVLTFADVVVRG